MPQCKRDGCREQAVPFGKRYCPEHMAQYRAKQKEYQDWQASAPKCKCCGGVMTRTRVDNGTTICGDCEAEQEEQASRYRKQQAFDNAETVEELKWWIRTYMLKGEI